MKGRKLDEKTKLIIQMAVIVFISAGIVIGFYLFVQSRNGPEEPDESSVSEDVKEKSEGPEEDPCVGQWECEGDSTFTIDIWQDETGICHAMVNRREKANVIAFWEMSGRASDGLFRYTDGKKSLTTYDKKGNESSREVYDGGKGQFQVEDSYIIWDDEEENAGKGIQFKQVGEY